MQYLNQKPIPDLAIADCVSIDLSVLKAPQHLCGITYPSPAKGIQPAELLEIAYQAGSTGAKVLSVSEYNPAIEKFRTGTFVAQLFTEFLHGLN